MSLVKFKRHKTKSYTRYRVRSPKLFKKSSFRTLDIGRPKHHMLVRGKLKKTGEWKTQAVIVKKGTKLNKSILKKARAF